MSETLQVSILFLACDLLIIICCVIVMIKYRRFFRDDKKTRKNCNFFETFETDDALISFPSDEYDDFLNSLNVFIKKCIKQNKECNIVIKVGFDKRLELFCKKDKNDKF